VPFANVTARIFASAPSAVAFGCVVSDIVEAIAVAASNAVGAVGNVATVGAPETVPRR
jgi:hypothetical protein